MYALAKGDLTLTPNFSTFAFILDIKNVSEKVDLEEKTLSWKYESKGDLLELCFPLMNWCYTEWTSLGYVAHNKTEEESHSACPFVEYTRPTESSLISMVTAEGVHNVDNKSFLCSDQKNLQLLFWQPYFR